MARRKQNVDMYGKSWSPIDLPNLEKAIKLYERLNYLQDHFASSLDGANAIMRQINETSEINEELKKMNIKLDEQQLKVLVSKLETQQKENQAVEEQNKKQIHNYSSSSQALKQRAGYSTSFESTTWGNAGYQTANALQQHYIDSKFKENLSFYQENARKMNKDPYSSLVSKLAQNKTINDIKGSAGKFSAAGTAMQLAADTIKNAFNEFFNLFKNGINKQSNIYNDTFTNISVRTGMTSSDYYAGQRQTRNALYSQNLQNNIGVSSVQEMWQSLANTGMNQTDMMANALDNVITKTIVPYLDTTSQSFNLINNRLDGNFSKQIRGISQASMEIAGNNYTTQEMLTTIIDQVQPMSDEAVENLAQGSAEVVAMINALTPSMGADAAKSYATQLFKAQKYSDQMLRSGTLDEQLAITGFLEQGINIYDTTQWNDAIASMIKNGMMYASWNSSGYSNTMSGLESNMIASSVGQSPERMMAIYSLMNSGKSIDDILNESNNIDLPAYGIQALNDLADDKNTTTKTEQEIYMENLSTDVAIWKEQWGVWYDVTTKLLKGIVSILGTYLAGKAVSGIAKGIVNGSSALSGIGSGLANGFASGASTAAGAGKIGAFTGTLGSVAGVAGIAAGGAMAVKGGLDVYNDFKSGDVNAGTAMSTVGAVGGAVGAGALIALGASNPVGWVALAVGGAGLLGRHLYDLATETGDISDELSKQSNQVIKNYREQGVAQINNLNQLRDTVKQTDDLETQKQLLISAGIASEIELQKEQYNSKENLVALTDAYIANTKKLNGTGENLLSELENNQNQEQNKVSEQVYSILDKKYKNMSDGDKQVAADFGKEYYKYISMLAESGDEDAQWRLEEWDKMGVNLLDDTWSEADLKAIMTKGNNATNNRLIKQYFTDSDRVRTITSYKSVQDKLGLDSAFSRTDYTTAINYLNAALLQDSKETALKQLEQAKTLGLSYDMLNDSYKTQLREKFQISSYKTGLDSVPYDNYPALLHEGEAVLTASTAYELRNLINEYRQNSNSMAGFEAVIQTQTATLVEKMDQIIENMKSGTPTSNENLSEAYSQKRNVLASMVSMTSTKAAFSK